MKIPLWLILVLFVGWTAWSTHYWYCQKWGHCGAAVPETPVQESSGEPLFRWNAAQPEADANFAKFKKALIKSGGQGDTLLITGWYRAGETKPADAASLGLARAAALKTMMMPEVPENRVHLAAREVTDSLAEGGIPRPSASFSWIKMVLKKEEGAIIESDNAVTFLFPFSSTEQDKDPAVEAYLKKLVEKHKTTTATFSVVGHTDNVDTDERNMALGLARANTIAKTLMNLGIDKGRIKVESKGESEPAADNNTEDGRHQNRRVVIAVNSGG